MAGCYELFIDNGTDIQTFCHADVINVFYFCYGLGYSQTLGGQTCQNIGFRTSCQGNKCFNILDTFFQKQFHVTTVSVNDHYIIVNQFCQSVTTVEIAFDDFRPHIIRHVLCRPDSNTASSHDHYIADICIIFFSGNLADVWDIFLCRCEINNIIELDRVVTIRDNGFISSFDGNQMEGNISSSQFMQRNIQDFSCLTHLCSDQHKSASCKFPPLADPAHLDGIYNFPGSQHLRINQRMHSQLCKEFFVLGKQVFIIVDAGNGFFRSKISCQHTGCHIPAFVRSDGDEQVGFFYAYFFQSGDGRRGCSDGHQVKIIAQSTELLFVVVH